MFTTTDWIRDKNGLMVLTPFPIKWAGKAAKQVYHKLRQKDTEIDATSRTSLQRKGSVLVQPLSLTSFDSSPSRGASGEEAKLYGMPKPPLARSNGDDRRQWRKQGGAVGAAASRMRAAAKQTLGAATRAVSPKVTERARTLTESFFALFCSKNCLKVHFIGFLFCYTPVRTKRHRREQE